MLLNRFLTLGLTAATAIAAVACAPLTVHSYSDSRANFATYRTYAWADDKPTATGDPRLDNNPFFHERLQRDADTQLASRGYEKTSAASPDLVLHYHANFSQQLDVVAVDRPYDVCTDCGIPSVYEAGTIVLDFVDATTNKLVWRGWAHGSMDGAIDNQAYMEQRIDEVVARVVATVPRH